MWLKHRVWSMSDDEFKQLSDTLSKVCERLSRLESGHQVQPSHLTTQDNSQWGPGFAATGGSFLQRSCSSPSLLQRNGESGKDTEKKFTFGSDQAESGVPRQPPVGYLRPDQQGAHSLNPSHYQFHQHPGIDGRGSVSMPDLKPRFEAIKNSVGKVVLDSDWCLPDSKQGIASGDRELAAILSRSAKFVETELKLMQVMQECYHDDTKVADTLDQVHLTQRAHMRYLQEEFSSLQVGGQFGPQAKSVFKSIRRSTTVYTPSFVDDIKTVLSITGTQQTQRPAAPRFPPNQRFRPRGQGGNFRGNFRFRQPGQHYQPRWIPPGRDDE